MKQYEIEVRNVMWTPTELFADFKSIWSGISNGETPIEISLPDIGQPHMFAIYLWALDSSQESPNYRVARRFVLTDNTSYLVASECNPIIPTTASEETNREWQVHLVPVHLNWTNHFYNNWHVHTSLLLPIRADGNLSISGVFEQETGELPVSGTDNVDGVVNFQYHYIRFSPREYEEQNFTDVIDPLSQQLLLDNTTVKDGDTLEVTVKAIDIMNNTLDSSLTLYIDSTPPLITNMYLVKDGYDSVFVHNSTDLSKMNMTFYAFDQHRLVYFNNV